MNQVFNVLIGICLVAIGLLLLVIKRFYPSGNVFLKAAYIQTIILGIVLIMIGCFMLINA